MADELVVRGEVRRVESAGKRGHSRANADVLRNAPRLFGIAGSQVQSGAIECEPKRKCACDRAGGAKNQNSIHVGRNLFRHPQPA